ncbi:hypothetical protein KFE25_000723 [Diacronema lutheri]|uniref:HTH La-type RNA-binding domain-containing protein n=1 Tax=Diacronema lutheri TaxID=2081491 RepID=A0A8J6CAA5_DIALT|nr:hypothetical protein KFE25_000723 [Diacronema lutheri]
MAPKMARVRVEMCAEYSALCVHPRVLLPLDAAWQCVGDLIIAALGAMQASAELADQLALCVCGDYAIADAQPVGVLRDDEECVLRRYGFHLAPTVGALTPTAAHLPLAARPPLRSEVGGGDAAGAPARAEDGRRARKRKRRVLASAPASEGAPTSADDAAYDARPSRPPCPPQPPPAGGDGANCAAHATMSKRAQKHARKQQRALGAASAAPPGAALAVDLPTPAARPRLGALSAQPSGGTRAARDVHTPPTHTRFDAELVEAPGSPARPPSANAAAVCAVCAAPSSAPALLRPSAAAAVPSPAARLAGAQPAWPQFLPVPLALPMLPTGCSPPALGRGRGALAIAAFAASAARGTPPARSSPAAGARLPDAHGPPPPPPPPSSSSLLPPPGPRSSCEVLHPLARAPRAGERIAFRAAVRALAHGGLPALSAYKEAFVEAVAGKVLTLSGRAAELAELRAGDADDEAAAAADADDSGDGARAQGVNALSRQGAPIRVDVYAHDLFDVRLLGGSHPLRGAAAAPAPAPAADAASHSPAAAAAPRAARPSYDKRASIRAQLEYYFSERNLRADEFMRGQVGASGEGYVPLALLGSFSRIARLGLAEAELAAAVRGSELLELSADEAAVRTRLPVALTC